MTDLFWVLLAVLLTLDLTFSTVRASLLNVRPPILLEMAEGREEQVERILRLLEKPRLRTSLRAGVMVNHFLLVGLVTWLVDSLSGSEPTVWVALGAAFLTALVLLVLEFALEGMVLPHAEAWALRLASLGRTIDLLISPFSSPLLLLLGSPAALQKRLEPLTEYELKIWVEKGEGQGSLDTGERQMIYSIFRFGETLCREIMVPRIDVLALELHTSIEEAIRMLTRSGHSRVPVYEDTIDNIVGLLYAKDLLRVRLEAQELASLRDKLRPAYFVPEAKKVDDLLAEMQTRRVHMAVVVDEYGGVAGLVTLEDIVEEIVGEIRDEYDQSEEQLYTQTPEGDYIFQGRVDLQDLNEVMGSEIDRDIADTVGGLIYGLLGRVPASGEVVEVDGLTLRVEHVSGRRIRTVRVGRKRAEQVSEDEEKTDESER